jgi:hypothetical protein
VYALNGSRRYSTCLLIANYLRLIRGILHKETFGIDRELHPDVSVWISLPHEAQGSLDVLSLDRHIEASSPIAYLNRDLHHLRSPYLLLYPRR